MVKDTYRSYRPKIPNQNFRNFFINGKEPLSPVSLGGSTCFLWKKCVVFQQMENNFHFSCQFFENQRNMRMLLFLPYDRSDRTFYSQTKVNSKTSKVIALRCYTWSLGIKKYHNRQGSVNQKEHSSKSSA